MKKAKPLSHTMQRELRHMRTTGDSLYLRFGSIWYESGAVAPSITTVDALYGRGLLARAVAHTGCVHSVTWTLTEAGRASALLTEH